VDSLTEGGAIIQVKRKKQKGKRIHNIGNRQRGIQEIYKLNTKERKTKN
jgi:hypothetical protein